MREGLWGSSSVAVGISCEHSDAGLKIKNEILIEAEDWYFLHNCV